MIFSKIIKITKNKNGAALFSVLIIIAIVATLATALFAYSSNSILSASIKEDSKQIEFLARSGIECAVKVWDSKTITEKITSYPLYFKSDGTIRGSDKDEIEYLDGEVGHCIITVDPEPEPSEIPADAPENLDLILFTSTAYMNGQTVKKKAYMSERMTGVVNASKWYTDEGKLIPGELNNNNLIYSVADVSSIFKDTSEKLLWGSCDGSETTCTLDHILFFETPSSKFLNISTDQKAMFIGRTIFFNMGINFTLPKKKDSNKDVGIVVFSGADIIITGDISLIIDETGHGCVNTVIFKTHEGIKDYLYSVTVGSNTKYMGKVYFLGNVYMLQYKNGAEQFRKKIISSGEAYYFDGKSDGGFDFTKFAADLYLDNGHGNSGSNAIKAFYNQGLGETYGTNPGYFLSMITDDTKKTPPIINTKRLIIWQN